MLAEIQDSAIRHQMTVINKAVPFVSGDTLSKSSGSHLLASPALPGALRILLSPHIVYKIPGTTCVYLITIRNVNRQATYRKEESFIMVVTGRDTAAFGNECRQLQTFKSE